MSYEYKGAFASLPQMERGRALVLGADPKGKNFLYCNARYVFVRDVENPAIVDIYGEHTAQASVAKYAPSGYYIASADVAGHLRIWDTTRKEHILKCEHRPMSGHIRDLVWSPDSKRIVVVGTGSDVRGVPIMWDSGNSLGVIEQHGGSINSVDYKPTRPYRVATGGDDNRAVVHEGPPFKYMRKLLDHKGFVHVVRYTPDGNLLLTGAQDGKVFIYDAKTGELVKSLGDDVHKASVFGLSFSPDGSKFLTCSGDKTAKIWDLETATAETVFNMGTELLDMQQGCLWMGDNLLTVSLSGYINYLDKNNPDTPLRVIKGHTNNVTAMTVSEDKCSIFTASHDGRVCEWEAATGVATEVTGAGHGTMVCAMEAQGDSIYSVGYDDQLKFLKQGTKCYEAVSLSTESQPKELSCGKNGLMAVAADGQVVLFRDGNRVFLQKEDYQPLAISVSPNQTEVAVGGSDNKVHIYNIDGDSLSQVNQLTLSGEVTAVEYSPDGMYLVAGCAIGLVKGWKVDKDYEPIPHSWTFHGRSRITKVAWSPDSAHFASAGLDSSINIWEVNTQKNVFKIEFAHQGSSITGLKWLSEGELITTGLDKNIKRWQIKF